MAAWFWLIAWGLWWLLVIMGAQGATPVLFITGVLGLPILLKVRPKLPLHVLSFVAFLAWCIVTTFWSPGVQGGQSIFVFDNENIAIHSPGLRLALTATAALFGFWITLNFKPKIYGWGLWAARFGMLVVFMFFAACLINWNIIVSLGESLSDAKSIDQNVIRATNLLVLSVPVFIAVLKFRNPLILLLSIVVLAAIALLLALKADAQAAILAILLSGLFGGLTYFIGRRVFHVLAGFTVVLLVTMPLIVGGILNVTSGSKADELPLSFQSRLATFDYVSDKLLQKWLFGWGVEASKDWDETHKVIAYGMEVDYKIVPGHPHNMPLQVWVETGLIGVVLLAITILLLGHHVYVASRDNSDKLTLAAGAALWGGALIFALVSYKVWNDAYWAGILFLTTGLLAVRKTSETA